MVADWLILHAGALGDLALTLQLALRLPGVGPASTLHVLSSTDPGDLSKCRPAIRRQSADGLGLHWLHASRVSAPPERLRELVAGRLVLNAMGRAEGDVHQQLKRLAPRGVISFDPRPRADLDRHITVQWQEDVEVGGARLASPGGAGGGLAALDVPDVMRAAGCETFRALGLEPRPFLIHPGSGGRSKCWPLADFLEVGRQLRDAGAGVCFVVGPVEQERWAAGSLDRIRGAFPVIVSPSSSALVTLLAAARVLISGDCGPAHLGAVLGTRTVTLFGPSAVTVWRPLGLNARVVAGGPAAHPGDWGISVECTVSEVMACVADDDRSS